MTFFCRIILTSCSLLLLLQSVAVASGEIAWQELEPGLDLARVSVVFAPSGLSAEAVPGEATEPPLPQSFQTASTTLLRIDPEKFVFSLYMASERGPKTFGEVGAGEGFVAAVNAGMFHRDRVTSTGYLRSGTHINNGHVAANFGAFFVANPKEAGIPQARVLDRSVNDWKTALERYDLVMQNYRMTAPGGRVIWKQASRIHSVAALSQDAKGRIFFIFCSKPVPAAEYMAALLRLPLNLETVMYLEGGFEAALFLNAGGVNVVEAGRHSSGLWGGSAGLLLPNVLGVRRRVDTVSGVKTTP